MKEARLFQRVLDDPQEAGAVDTFAHAAPGARAAACGCVWLHGLGAGWQFMVSEEREEAQSKSPGGHLDPPWEVW